MIVSDQTFAELTSEAPTDRRRGLASSAGGLLVFMTCLNILSLIDRQLLASSAAFVVPELGLSNTEFALLTGVAFVGIYSVVGIGMGLLADRVHRPRLIAAGLLVWSAATVATGTATSFIGLLIPRMIVGVGEAVLGPGALSMLSERFPPARLGLMNGIYSLSAPVGVALSLIAVGLIAPSFGWRTTFYALGALGLVAVVALLFVRENPARDHRIVVARPPIVDQMRDAWRFVRSSPSLIFTLIGGFLAQAPLGAAAFEQLWMVGERGLDPGPIAVRFGMIALVFGILGGLLGGYAADAWQRRFGSGRTMIIVLATSIIAPIQLVARLAPPDSFVFWLGPIGMFLSIGLVLGIIQAAIQELAPNHLRASVIAILILVLTIGRDVVGVTSAGVLIDVFATSGIAQPYTWALFTMTCAGALSIPFLFYASIAFKRETRLRASATAN